MSNQTNDRISRIEQAYVHTRQTLENGAHKCTPDTNGKCKYCPKLVTLEPKGRTGELS